MKKISAFLEILSIYDKDPYRKTYAKTLYEATRCMIKEKEFSAYYFSHLLYKKDIPTYLDYIVNKKLLKIKQEVLKPNHILDDKLLFQNFIQEHGLPGPACLAYIDNGHFILGNSSDKLTSSDKLLALLQASMNSNAALNSIFIKPTNGIGGAGTHKLKKEDLLNSKTIDKLFTVLQKGKHIIQEAVVQHATMNCLSSSSLNTIRILSYRKPTGELGIASALCRMGREGAHIDNASCGGIFVPINLNNSKLEQYGYSFISSGGSSYISHPDTGTVFKDFELPHFSQALELVLRAARFFQNILIGWDIAITANGPLFIEGNHNPHLIGTQIACGGFRRHPIYKELFKEYL